MSFRIKTHSENPNLPTHVSQSTPVNGRISPKKEEKVTTLSELPRIPVTRAFKYNEVPVEKINAYARTKRIQ